MNLFANWKVRARQLKTEAHALYLACRDPRVPWYARLFAALALGYLFSPIDLIPDFIPVIGYLDDLVLVPLFIVIARKLIPAEVMAEHREHARATADFGRPKSWIAATAIVGLWTVTLLLIAFFVWRSMR